MSRYFADRFGDEGLFVFDRADGGSECCGPFPTLAAAEEASNNLNTDEGVELGLRPHQIQRLLNPEGRPSIHDGRQGFAEALAAFKLSGEVLDAAWDEDQQVENYPSYLPSFDELVAALADLKPV